LHVFDRCGALARAARTVCASGGESLTAGFSGHPRICVEFSIDSKGTSMWRHAGGHLMMPGRRASAGRDLGGDARQTAPLANALAQHARAVVLLIGATHRGSARWCRCPGDARCSTPRPARGGDVGSSSRPYSGEADVSACASFDMFDNYVHRAEVCSYQRCDLTDERAVWCWWRHDLCA
jgi:hypothetical protein